MARDVRGQNGRTPLHLTSYQHQLKMIKLLKSLGADIKAKDDDGKTPQELDDPDRFRGMN